MEKAPDALKRFLSAQEKTYALALAELKAGKKESHFMWYLFPQLRGLGKSPMSYTYGIASPREAQAYLAHPILGPRLLTCCEALLSCENKSAREILGETDEKKLFSSMTLFALFSEENSLFQRVLDRFFEGKRDENTKKLLNLKNDTRSER